MRLWVESNTSSRAQPLLRREGPHHVQCHVYLWLASWKVVNFKNGPEMSCSKILLDSIQSAAVSWAWRWTERPVQGGQRRVEDRTGQRWLSALTSCCLPFYPSLWLGFIFMTCTNFCILGLCHCTHLCLTLKSQPQRKRWNGLGWSANSRTLRTAKMSWNQWWQSHNLANPQDPLSSTLWKMNFTGFYEFMWIPSQKNASKCPRKMGIWPIISPS